MWNLRGNDSADNTHDTINTDGNAVSRAAMGRRQHFGSVGVEAAVVDVLRGEC